VRARRILKPHLITLPPWPAYSADAKRMHE
jgi:hypothetical protein